MQHADDGYFRRAKLSGLLVRNTILIYSPEDTDVYGSRTTEIEALKGVESCKNLVPRGHFLFTCSDTYAFCCRMYRLATIHRQTTVLC